VSTTATDLQTLILTAEEVESLLDVGIAIELMDQALRGLDRGDYHQPLRTVMIAPNAPGMMGLMPSFGGQPEAAYGLKAGCVTPGNRERGIDMHQGVMALFDGPTGRVRSIMNLSPVTAVRTAAVSAVATRALANPGASRLCLIGAGLQAWSHLAALDVVCDLESVTVWTPRRTSAQAFAERASGEYPFAIRATATAEEAVRAADIVVTATPATADPVISRAWLAPGTHLNAVGACTPETREIDAATVADAVVIVDRRESASKEAGDLVLAEAEGAIGPDHVRGELGELLNGRCPGRQAGDELTLFESLGIGVQDLAVSVDLERRARAAGIGTLVAF
jgi:ornithine cyclodeaminase